MQRIVFAAAILSITASCGDSTTDRVSRPEGKDLQGIPIKTSTGSLVVAAHYSGGAPGDKTYKILGCPDSAQKCEVLATVDPYDQSPPELVTDRGAMTLIVNRRDSIAGFRNFSHDLQTDRGSVVIRYR